MNIKHSDICFTCFLPVCCSVAKLCPTLCNPMDYSTPDFPVLHLQSLLQVMSIELVMLSNHLILCHPLLLLPSIFPSIRVFSNESALHIRCQNIGASASVSVLPMNIQGWFPLRLIGLISLQSKELSRIFSSTTIWKHSFKCMFLGIYQLFFYVVQFVVI